MALSSTDTLSTVVAQYVDNADWWETQSLAKAKLFTNAIRVLKVKRPERSQHEGQAMAWNAESLEAELDRVTSWIASHPDFNADSQQLTHASFEDYR